MKGSFLGEFEELVLLAVCVLPDEAYGVSLTDLIQEQTQRSVHLSAVHTALYRLEEKGFVTSVLGGATASRGGRRKRLFQVTASGKRALMEAREVRNQFWNQIPNLIWEGL